MSLPQGLARGAVASQLAATLQAYEQDVGVLARGPFDTESYERASRHMELMRLYASALPTLSASWVELMIRHFELTHGIWRLQRDGAGGADLPRLHADLQGALERLARKCALLCPAA